MTLIVGATQYLNASTLANTKGLSPSTPNLLGEGSTASLLEAGRSSLAIPGMGVSSAARALNNQLLNSSADINKLFSLGVGSGATMEGLAQEILALRGSLRDDQLAPELRGQVLDTVDSEGNKISAQDRVLGKKLDTNA